MNNQTMFIFFNDLHIDLNVAIEKRKNFDAMIDRETISVQNIDFFDVSIDKKIEKIFEKIKVTDDSTTNFDDVKNDKKDEIDRNDEKNDKTEKVNDFDSKTNEITNC